MPFVATPSPVGSSANTAAWPWAIVFILLMHPTIVMGLTKLCDADDGPISCTACESEFLLWNLWNRIPRVSLYKDDDSVVMLNAKEVSRNLGDYEFWTGCDGNFTNGTCSISTVRD